MPGPVIIAPDEELDIATVDRFRDELGRVLEDGADGVVIDLSEVGFIDSTGLSVLVGGLKRLRDAGGSLVVRSPSASTRRLFDITGLTRIFEIC